MIKNNKATLLILKALGLFKEQTCNVINFGNRAIDFEYSNKADIERRACFWGTKDRSKLVKSKYSHAIIRTNEIIYLTRQI